MKWLGEQFSKDPIVKEMGRFRAVRWAIVLFIVGIVWITGSFSSYKGWVACLVVFFVAIFAEFQELQTHDENRENNPVDRGSKE
jgi:hypothetical protein